MTAATDDTAAQLPPPNLLVLLVAVSSAAALMLEIVAGRLVAPYLGMSLHSWTAVIAVVLAGLSFGALLGGRLADEALGRGRNRLAAALGLAAFFTLLAPVLLRRTAALLGAADLPATIEVLVVATAMLFVPSVFAGMVSPLATRLALAQTPPEGTGRMLGRMFAAGAAGSIAGTVLAGFVLLGYLGSLASVVLVAGLYALSALTLFARGRLASQMALLLAGAGIVYGAGTTVGAWRSPCVAESEHSCIRITDAATPNGNPARILVIDHLTHGINARDEPNLFAMGYLELADLLARRRFDGVPRRSFFLGGGAYTLPRAWLEAGEAMVVAEIDPLVTAMAESRLWLERTPNLEVVHDDARVVLRQRPSGERFDVVVGDAFQDVTVPPHLVTREFAALVRARLTDDGLYMVNVIDEPEHPAFVAALARTLRTSFSDVTIWREAGAHPAQHRANHLLVATDRPLGVDEVRGPPPYTRHWTTVTADVEAPLLTDDYSPVERLLVDGPL